MGGSPFLDVLPPNDNLELFKIRISEGNGLNGVEAIYINVFTKKLTSLGKHGNLSSNVKEITLND